MNTEVKGDSLVGRLSGKRILVAGSATGIGAATAYRLAVEGARLYLGDINTEGLNKVVNELKSKGADVAGGWFDLADEESIDQLVANAVDFLGDLDGLANIAADLRPETIGKDVDLLNLDLAVWDRTLRANLMGYVLLSKYAIPHLIEAGGGAIVNTSSDASFSGEATRPAYAASKAAINALSRHIASAYGKQGIRANTIRPGGVMTEQMLASQPEEFKAILLEAVKVARVGEPGDIAGAIAYLLSEDGQWITGQTWSVNGGSGYRE
ncbi:MAG: SDR family oxidoreductase [Prevotella sp.]|jgi:NAD(P)-dependent dehydrogenase (short-subunit alcohol dehydrogenase family)|nr:SDR family oxidoreductase [Prevotella sp.]